MAWEHFKQYWGTRPVSMILTTFSGKDACTAPHPRGITVPPFAWAPAYSGINIRTLLLNQGPGCLRPKTPASLRGGKKGGELRSAHSGTAPREVAPCGSQTQSKELNPGEPTSAAASTGAVFWTNPDVCPSRGEGVSCWPLEKRLPSSWFPGSCILPRPAHSPPPCNL